MRAYLTVTREHAIIRFRKIGGIYTESDSKRIATPRYCFHTLSHLQARLDIMMTAGTTLNCGVPVGPYAQSRYPERIFMRWIIVQYTNGTHNGSVIYLYPACSYMRNVRISHSFMFIP